MALDLSLRRFSLLPRFIQTGNGEPPKAHFVRRSDPLPAGGDQETGGNHDDDPKQSKPGKHRRLSDITMGEVRQAIKLYERQLVAVDGVEWVAANYFCTFPLQRPLFDQGRSPVVFGRVGSCYPTEGIRENLRELELYFPHKNEAPELFQLRNGELNHQEPIQSYRLGIKMYLSKKEQREFLQDNDQFLHLGYAPSYEAEYRDMLELSERDRPALPWVYVFGSEWFATVPDSWQVDVKRQIDKLLRWNRVVLNFHPRRHLLKYKSLNDEMEFNLGFTEHYLFMPQDTEQTALKLDEVFGEKFLRGLG
jgi:hypothetical protein